MTQPSTSENASTPRGHKRWQVTLYQLLFGAMAVGLGGLISAEPTMSLDRQEDGRLECRYVLDAYGGIPTLAYSVDDLVRYEVTEGRSASPRGGSSGTPMVFSRFQLHLIGRDGSSFSVGQTWNLLDLDQMMEGSAGESSHTQRVEAGGARRYGGIALGLFGLLLLSGSIWNVFLMLTGFGSANAIAPG